jgi:hypothetical protein
MTPGARDPHDDDHAHEAIVPADVFVRLSSAAGDARSWPGPLDVGRDRHELAEDVPPPPRQEPPPAKRRPPRREPPERRPPEREPPSRKPPVQEPPPDGRERKAASTLAVR